MGEILEKLTLDENNRMFSLTCDLCDENARHGFMEGLRLGLQLAAELGE